MGNLVGTLVPVTASDAPAAAVERAGAFAPGAPQLEPQSGAPEQFSCPLCGKPYKTEEGLKKHMSDKHPDDFAAQNAAAELPAASGLPEAEELPEALAPPTL